jgi:hypothetical protein
MPPHCATGLGPTWTVVEGCSASWRPAQVAVLVAAQLVRRVRWRGGRDPQVRHRRVSKSAPRHRACCGPTWPPARYRWRQSTGRRGPAAPGAGRPCRPSVRGCSDQPPIASPDQADSPHTGTACPAVARTAGERIGHNTPGGAPAPGVLVHQPCTDSVILEPVGRSRRLARPMADRPFVIGMRGHRQSSPRPERAWLKRQVRFFYAVNSSKGVRLGDRVS